MSELLLNELSVAPSTPASGKGKIYAKGKKVYSKDSDGISHLLTQDAFGLNLVIGDGISVITTGVAGYIEVPFSCTISSVRLFAKEAGAIVVDIWKDTYANFPPTNADSITSASHPTITATNQKSENPTLYNWIVNLSAGDILVFNVDSVTTITQVTISVRGTKT